MHIGWRHQSLHRRGLLPTITGPWSVVHSIDALAYVVSALSLLFTIDQVRSIWIERNASGVSLLSWLFYTISALVWLSYGVVHKDKLITSANVVWMTFSLCIVIGVVMYS